MWKQFPMTFLFKCLPGATWRGVSPYQRRFLGGGMMPSIGFDDESGDKVFSDRRLSEVDYADYEYMSVLGIYARTRINYYGK